jgi:uncharacterized protein (TIGR02118 family)
MFKTITVISLRPGVDPEEFFKYHTEVHSLDAIKAACGKIKRYVINRLVQMMGGKEQKFYGLVEMWWDSKEDCEAYSKMIYTFKAASGISLSEDFESHGAILEYKIQVEEKELLQ